jgi:nucleoside-diphosphate-sugar epimerase
MLNILILGSEGFIGTHLVRYFKNIGYEVHGCDLASTASCTYHYARISKAMSQWETVFSGRGFSFCINASGSGNVNSSVMHPFTDFESNTLDTMRILEAIRLHNPNCRYLHISSAAVYGNPVLLPVEETAEVKPISPYGWHKLMAEMICREYNEIYGISIAIVRPFSIYGPGLRKQLFWDTYQKFLKNPSELSLWGTGDETRDFIYIDDVVHFFDLLLEKAPMQGECYNVGTGISTSIREAVQMLFKGIDCHPEIHFNGQNREGDPLYWQSSNKKMTDLGFIPAIDFITGAQQLANWLNSLQKEEKG